MDLEFADLEEQAAALIQLHYEIMSEDGYWYSEVRRGCSNELCAKASEIRLYIRNRIKETS